MIRVAVVDDHALVRAGFTVLLRSAPDIEVVGGGGTGTAAISLARTTHPDVMLMDIRMPDMDGSTRPGASPPIHGRPRPACSS